MDEAAFLYRQTPRFTYCFDTEPTPRGTSIKKDHLTLIFCSNATGTHKIPLTVIGKSKKPRSFKNSTVPLHYMSSSSGWINSKLYTQWFDQIFLPEIESRTDKPILLIMDNYSVHKMIESRQIDIVFLPPNVTSTSQPLDQGIISKVKRSYRTNLLRSLIGYDFENFLNTINSNRRSLGLGYGLPNILDACKLIKNAWDEVDQETIARCWLKSKLLPETFECNLRNDYTEFRQTLEENEIEQLCQKIDKVVFVSQNISISIIESKKKLQVRRDIEDWYELETNPYIMVSLIEEQLKESNDTKNKQKEEKNDEDDEKKEQRKQEEDNISSK